MGHPVFVSYSHKDAHHLAALRKHTASLEQRGLISVWHDAAVEPGAPWAEAIRSQLNASRLVLALVSPDFLRSPWCLAELGRTFERREHQLVDVVPIIVRPCEWHPTPLGAIQAPNGGAAIETFPDQDKAWADVAKAIECLLGQQQRAEPAWPTREVMVTRYAEILETEQRLMVLAPWRAGLEDLAQAIAQRTHGEHFTTLRLPTITEMATTDFYAELAGNASVASATAFRTWLKTRCGGTSSKAATRGARHLVVLPYFGGPSNLVRELGHVMRGVFDELDSFSLLVVGRAHCAKLLGDVQELSLFSGIRAEHLPGLSLEETRTILINLGADPVYAKQVHQATGGHPEWAPLAAIEVRAGRLQSLAQTIADNKVFNVLRDRLMQQEAHRQPHNHAATALQKLLDHQPVIRLSDARYDLGLPEARLYFDGILEERDRQTVFRCEAARLAARRALDVWRQQR